MSQIDIEKLFNQLDHSVKYLRQETDWSYLEALSETSENILEKELPEEALQAMKSDVVEKLMNIYQNTTLDQMTPEEIRKSFQLALLKGMSEDRVQTNHQMTPDAIGFLFVYLIDKFKNPNQKNIRVLDPAVGTGNLLETIYNALISDRIVVDAEGIDNDDLLLSLASVSSIMQNQKIKFTHQDALQDLLVDPVDIIVSDLPVGYYPVDERAKLFETSAEKGHSFAHHLFIEQGFHYLKESGLAFYLVPSHLFETKEAPRLLKLIQQKGYLQGLLHLPKVLFADERSRKSIAIIQKKGELAKQAKEIVLAEIPDLKNQQALLKFMKEIDEWKKDNM